MKMVLERVFSRLTGNFVIHLLNSSKVKNLFSFSVIQNLQLSSYYCTWNDLNNLMTKHISWILLLEVCCYSNLSTQEVYEILQVRGYRRKPRSPYIQEEVGGNGGNRLYKHFRPCEMARCTTTCSTDALLRWLEVTSRPWKRKQPASHWSFNN